MIYLVLRVVFTLVFSHLLRYAEARTPRPLWAMTINYGVAVLLCGAWIARERVFAAGAPALVLGGLAGVTYVTSLLFFLPAIRTSGIGIAGTVLQLALMLPIGVSIVRHGELPSALQATGIGMALVALPLLTLSRSVGSLGDQPRFSPWALLLFLSSGISQATMKEFNELSPARERPLFTLVLFVVATVLTYGASQLMERRPRPLPAAPRLPILANEWVIGSLLGVANITQLWLLLLALSVLEGIIVFPVSACLGVVLNVLVAMALWRERPRAAAWVGIGLAAAAVALLNA